MMRFSLAQGLFEFGGRIRLRPVTAEDGALVSYWRNSDVARAHYFNPAVVTPDSHAAWLLRKDPLDCVWLVELQRGLEIEAVIGMTSLTIAPGTYEAEYGRTFVDPCFRGGGRGYGVEIEYTCMAVAFEVFNLQRLTGHLVPDNSIAAIHDRIGWRRIGLNVPEHTHAGYDVLYIEFLRQDWPAARRAFVDWMRDKHASVIRFAEET